MSRSVESHIITNLQIISAMNNDAALVAVTDNVLLDNRTLDAATHVEMDGLRKKQVQRSCKKKELRRLFRFKESTDLRIGQGSPADPFRSIQRLARTDERGVYASPLSAPRARDHR